MKKQETVDKNFQKVVDQWEISRSKKIERIDKALQEIARKNKALLAEYHRLEADRTRLIEKQPPEAPSVSVRSEQLQKMSLDNKS